MEELKTDVAVAAYGPVGRMLAIVLAEKGHHVVVVERQKASYPALEAVMEERIKQPDGIDVLTEQEAVGFAHQGELPGRRRRREQHREEKVQSLGPRINALSSAATRCACWPSILVESLVCRLILRTSTSA